MLLAAANLAVDRWNADRGQPCDLIKVSVPTNLRPEGWRFEVVANIVHLHLVSSTPEERSTPRALFDAIAPRRVGSARAGVRVALLVADLGLLDVQPGRLPPVDPAASPPPRAQAGVHDPPFQPRPGRDEARRFRPRRPNHRVLVDPALHRQMGFSIGINILHGRILLSMRHRLTHLDAAAARAFFDLFREQLLALNSADI